MLGIIKSLKRNCLMSCQNGSNCRNFFYYSGLLVFAEKGSNCVSLVIIFGENEENRFCNQTFIVSSFQLPKGQISASKYE